MELDVEVMEILFEFSKLSLMSFVICFFETIISNKNIWAPPYNLIVQKKKMKQILDYLWNLDLNAYSY